MKWLLCLYCCFMWTILVIIFGYLISWKNRLNEESKKYKDLEKQS